MLYLGTVSNHVVVASRPTNNIEDQQSFYLSLLRPITTMLPCGMKVVMCNDDVVMKKSDMLLL